MLSRFLTAHLARFLVTPAKPALENVFTRSLMVSLRVASPKATDTTVEPKEKKTKTASKEKKERKGPIKSKNKETPKKIVITDDMKPPKRPLSPFMIFLQEHSSKSSKPSSAQEARGRAQELSTTWHALSSTEKEQYSEDFRRRQVEYKQKREEWFKNVDPEVLKLLNKKRIAKGRPKLIKSSMSRPPNTYALFVSRYHIEHKDSEQNLSFIERSRAASSAWRSLSEEEKKSYKDHYKQEMDEWRQHKAAAGA